LANTLQAIRELRTYRKFEVIWVDNASTDNTAAVLHEELFTIPFAKYVYCKQVGLGAARNLGWQHSSGGIVIFTDDDCYPLPDYIDAWMNAFSDRPTAGVMGGRILLHNPDHAKVTIEEGETPRTYPAHSYFRAGQLQGANIAFRREALNAIGGIDPELGAGTRFPCEDVDAVAAVLWAGFAACFDPRPCVRHDHGRAEAEIPVLLDSYDRGRGAYFAKYILRSDSRLPFVMGWLRSALRRRGLRGLRTLRIEMASAAEYAKRKGRYGFLIIAAPLCGLVFALQALISLVLWAAQIQTDVGEGSIPPKPSADKQSL
jgi:GT2 family glycosyltransferase